MADLDELTRRLEELERQQQRVEREREQYKQLYLEMMEHCRKLERGLMGQKSERLPPK